MPQEPIAPARSSNKPREICFKATAVSAIEKFALEERARRVAPHRVVLEDGTWRAFTLLRITVEPQSSILSVRTRIKRDIISSWRALKQSQRHYVCHSAPRANGGPSYFDAPYHGAQAALWRLHVCSSTLLVVASAA